MPPRTETRKYEKKVSAAAPDADVRSRDLHHYLIRKYTLLEKLVSLFAVMLIFFLLGSVLKWTLDYFEGQNEKRRLEEGDVIEKENEEAEDGQNPAQEEEASGQNET